MKKYLIIFIFSFLALTEYSLAIIGSSKNNEISLAEIFGLDASSYTLTHQVNNSQVVSAAEAKDFLASINLTNKVNPGWKVEMTEQFYRDIASIKEVFLDGESDEVARTRFLESFRKQQDWFDLAIASTQVVGDVNYNGIIEKRFFVARIANAQKRADELLIKFTKKMKVDSSQNKKVRLNILSDINNHVSEEIKKGLRESKNPFLSKKVVQKIVEQNLNDLRRGGLNVGSINFELLNDINSSMGKLITKDDYQSFSSKLRKNINNELKDLSFSLERKMKEEAKKNNEEFNKNYQVLLNNFDIKISSTEEKLQGYIDKKMDILTQKIDVLTKKQDEKRGFVDLEVVEKNMKNYFDEKLKILDQKILNARILDDKNPEKKEMKNFFDISKKTIDKKIYAEVGRQLSSLKEDRIKKYEKLSRNKKKSKRRKVIKYLLEKELDKNFD
ncbi:MAG: hypothetical protein ABIF12_02580 [bacterium]